jgi:hypothetical protein
MSLKITQRRREEVPTPSGSGKVNQDLINIRDEMRRISSGMVLEIDAGTDKAVRGTKMLVTKAANQLGTKWKHWNQGTIVFAEPAEAGKRRGRPRKAE